MKVDVTILPIWPLKLAVVVTLIEKSQNEWTINQALSYVFNSPKNLVKIGPVLSEITCIESWPVKISLKREVISGKTYSPFSRHSKRAKLVEE